MSLIEDPDFYRIEIVDNYLKIDFLGSWSRAITKQFVKDFKYMANQLKHNPWGCLVNMLDWGLGTPETTKEILELQDWCIRHNQKFEATIVRMGSLQNYQMDSYIADKYRGNVEHRYVEDEDEGLDFFKELGYR